MLTCVAPLLFGPFTAQLDGDMIWNGGWNSEWNSEFTDLALA